MSADANPGDLGVEAAEIGTYADATVDRVLPGRGPIDRVVLRAQQPNVRNEAK